jgi:hypothetical protein
MKAKCWLNVLGLEVLILVAALSHTSWAFQSDIISYPNKVCVSFVPCTSDPCIEVGRQCSVCTTPNAQSDCEPQEGSTCVLLFDHDGCGVYKDGTCQEQLGSISPTCVGPNTTAACHRVFCGHV